MTAVLELRRVSKAYGQGPTEVQALREVDLSVDGGELVAVMGPSGSGKSTLLTIAGSLRTRPAARCWWREPRSWNTSIRSNKSSGSRATDPGGHSTE
jgi:ABC-type lipoprotein export system ATPase subunit